MKQHTSRLQQNIDSSKWWGPKLRRINEKLGLPELREFSLAFSIRFLGALKYILNKITGYKRTHMEKG